MSKAFLINLPKLHNSFTFCDDNSLNYFKDRGLIKGTLKYKMIFIIYLYKVYVHKGQIVSRNNGDNMTSCEWCKKENN